MQWIGAIPLPIRLTLLGICGAVLAGQINRAIYRWAWNARAIGPWSAPHPRVPPRRTGDRIPIVGWWWLRREANVHGTGYWVRPLLIECVCALGIPLFYLWHLDGGLLPIQPGVPPQSPAAIHVQFFGQWILLSLMMIGSFIDIDEQTIPDAVTITGTMAGVLWAALFPQSLLPASIPVGFHPPAFAVRPLYLSEPFLWPAWLDSGKGLVLGWLCVLAWCWAILPKTWYLRRGWIMAMKFLFASIARNPGSWIIGGLTCIGLMFTLGAWWIGGDHWRAALTALCGLVFGGAIIWAIRVVGSRALGKEAMGFGDVTLMGMIGTFVGWQSTLIIFFLAPFAGMIIGVIQYIFFRENAIAYGPFLCAATLVLILGWPTVWLTWGYPVFLLGWWIPALYVVCLTGVGGMLWAWRLVRRY